MFILFGLCRRSRTGARRPKTLPKAPRMRFRCCLPSAFPLSCARRRRCLLWSLVGFPHFELSALSWWLLDSASLPLEMASRCRLPGHGRRSEQQKHHCTGSVSGRVFDRVSARMESLSRAGLVCCAIVEKRCFRRKAAVSEGDRPCVCTRCQAALASDVCSNGLRGFSSLVHELRIAPPSDP